MASMAMGFACLLVGYGGLFRDEITEDEYRSEDDSEASSTSNSARGQQQVWGLAMELLGVSFISFQCSLGEVSD